MLKPFILYSDQKLIKFAEELQGNFISEDSELRKIAFDIYGNSYISSLLGLNALLAFELAVRLKACSPHIEK